MHVAIAHNNRKWILPVTIALLLVTVFCFVYTSNIWLLLIPVCIAYLFLIIVNWKKAYWLFLLCIPLSIQFSILNNQLALSLPDEPISWVFLGIAVLLLAYRPTLLPKWFINNPISLVVLLQFVWLIPTVVCSTVASLSVKFLLAKIWYLASFFILPVWIFREKKDIRTGFLLLLLPMVATMIIIFTRQAVLHFQFVNIGAAIGVYYINHVEYAAVISIFFPLVCVAYPLTKKHTTWVRVLLLLTIIFFAVAIFFTYARAAILAVAFAAMIGFAIKKKFVKIVMPVFYGLVGVTIIYLAQDKRYIDLRPDFEHTYMHSDYSSHLVATLRGQDMSSMERLYRWVAAMRMSNERPFLGYGPHGFYYHYKSYALPVFRTYVSKNEEHSTTHNYFLYMLTEQGWPAMLLYAILIMVVFGQSQNTYHRFKDQYYKSITLGLAMAFAVCFVNNFFSELIETHKVGALFYLIIALLVILDKKSRDIEHTPAL